MIRPMKKTDYEAVYKLWDETPEVLVNEKDDSYEKIAGFIEMNPNLCFVAEEDGEIVGSIMGGFDGRRGHLYHLVVKTDHRKNGLGKKLVEAVDEELTSMGVHEVDLIAFASNITGNEFWEKRGFLMLDGRNYRRKDL